MTTRVLITCPQMQNHIEDFRDAFTERGAEVVLPDVVQQLTEDQLIDLIGDFDGMIAGDDPLTARVLEHADRMRIISKWGAGTDGIDVEAARNRGIQVANTPGVLGEDVADVALAYLVMLARQLHVIDASVKAGGWTKHEGRSLHGRTLGIAGFGNVGQAVGRRAVAYGMTVITTDISPVAQSAAERMGVSLVDRDALFARSHALVLCCPLTSATHHMVNAESLGLMPAGGYLVNVARGSLVDEVALVDSLRGSRLAAAALDVFEIEPLPADSPLRDFPQCVFGSHNGSNSTEAVLRASELAIENLFSGLAQT
jgi:D-3-phosphoglycerate dehydrogenase / 2-oxoglutarate reductase